MEALHLGLANWLATTIVVESELFRPLRRWLDRRSGRPTSALQAIQLLLALAKGQPTSTPGQRWWRKAAYLVSCHLCAGMWIALVQAVAVGSRPGVVGVVVDALVYKAIGHLVLEAVGVARSLRVRVGA